MRFDLHSHSTCSDGLLSPAELVERAVQRGVDVLALTDHDEIKGLADARTAAKHWGLRLIDGVEISVLWEEVTLHIVGLNIDTGHAPLVEGLASIRNGREQRARRMAESLAAAGIDGGAGSRFSLARLNLAVGQTSASPDCKAGGARGSGQ